MEGLLRVIIPLITAIITGIVGPIIAYYYRKKRRHKKSTKTPSSDDENLSESKYLLEKRKKEIDKNIDEKLNEIRNKLSADRSWIIQFHDGKTKDQSVDSLKKFSMVYESVNQGISSEKKNFENLLVSFFLDTVNKIVKEKELIYDDVDNIENTEIVRIFDQKGNSSMYMFAMETIDDILIGILGVDFVTESHQITEKEKHYLRKQAYSLAGYLYNREVE